MLDSVFGVPSAMTFAAVLLLISIACFVGAALLGSPNARERRHRRKQASAKRVRHVLTAIAHPGQQLAYLRKIDPFVFEELLLDAFEQHGYQVRRSHRYSGDGGIDGVVFKHGQKHLIQAKRYSGHIQLAHVKQFEALVSQHQCSGLFIHTGRTGKQSREITLRCPGIQMISGQRLLAFLAYRSTPTTAGAPAPNHQLSIEHHL